MDDLQILRALGGTDPVPDPESEARARTALLTRTQAAPPVPARAARRTPWGRFGRRIAVSAVAAAVAIGALAVVESTGPDSPGGQVAPVLPGLPAAKPANAAEALGYAADAAAQRSFTMPKPDQWLYLETKLTSGKGPGGFVTGGPYDTETSHVWWRIDGAQFARYSNGKLVVSPTQTANNHVARSYPYAEIANLPADPDAVLAFVRRKVGGVGGGTRDGEDQIAFVTINAILRDNLLPPGVEAAFFRALGKLSGVTLVPDAVNLDGRPAIAVARVQEGWLREEILLDPQTYRLIGERSVAIADHTVRADDGTLSVKKGTIQRLVVLSAAAIVDVPGRTS